MQIIKCQSDLLLKIGFCSVLSTYSARQQQQLPERIAAEEHAVHTVNAVQQGKQRPSTIWLSWAISRHEQKRFMMDLWSRF